jgi:hypothetical protein
LLNEYLRNSIHLIKLIQIAIIQLKVIKIYNHFKRFLITLKNILNNRITIFLKKKIIKINFMKKKIKIYLDMLQILINYNKMKLN